MIGVVGFTTVVALLVEVAVVGLAGPPTIVFAFVVAFRIGAPNTEEASGELTRVFSLLEYSFNVAVVVEDDSSFGASIVY